MSNAGEEVSGAAEPGKSAVTPERPRDPVEAEIAGVLRPPSDVAQRVEELLAENARLLDAVTARDTFLAVAAHELRNPMTPIVGRVERLRHMLRKPGLDIEAIERGLVQIEWLIGRYLKRATTLLDVSRVTAGKLRLDRTETDLCRVVREVVESFRPLVEHAGSSLTVTLPEHSVIRVCDRLALEQILDNLVSNAIKYGAGQPIEVKLIEDSIQRHVRLQVRDHGPGISAESQARIFERFERAVRPGEHVGGFGVGLWIVRQLAGAMGGTVAVLSRPDEGSTFIVTLPLPAPDDR